ncbi:MAG: ATP-dependent Clp protease proteolytic subunit [Clostridia bacterium]|nr:ATP-dependent Clp protease proteolytic subunit [Clostridia bacterium]
MNHDEREEALGEERASCPAEGETPWNRVITGEGVRIQTIPIIGQIEGHAVLPPPAKTTKYEHLLPELVLAEESEEVDGVLFLINTVGGDVEAGLAMAEMIAGMTKPTCSLVLGGGHSIGIPLAVAADRAYMAESATMTVHPVRINGLVLGVPQSFEYLTRMQERIEAFILAHSRIAPEVFRRFLTGHSDMATDIGSILSGREAAASGLVDGVASFGQVMAHLKKMAKQKKG